METVTVAVGSTRAPKLEAVRQALASYSEALGSPQSQAEFEVVSVAVPSGVGHTPQSRAELMAGARGRASALVDLARQQRASWRYFIGLEGGVDIVQENGRRWVFLENWAYVTDAQGREAYGQAGGIVLPELLAEQVVDRGIELAEAIDAYAGSAGIRDLQGAWGVLTGNRITRQETYRIAVIQALAPFFNRQFYP